MAKIPYENPGSTEVQSPLIAGITDGLNKISGMVNMKTKTDTVNLQEVYIDATNRYRMYEAPQGQKNWLRSPEPIIRKNGNIINPTMDFFTISYMGGSITFAEDARQTSTDEFSAEVTFIVESDLEMPLKADLDPDTKKLLSSQIPDTLATKEELKPLQDKLEMDKGYFTDAEQLKRTYPVGEVGWHAVVGTTDTVWIWDGDTGAWVNSGTSDINASKVPFTKTTEVDSTNVQDAIEKLGINKANKDLTNVENTIFKNKGSVAGLAYKDLTNITDLTFKQKGDAAGLATKDLSNVDNTIFKAKGNSAGLAYKDLTNIVDNTFKEKGMQSGLELLGQCNCTKTGTNFNLIPVTPIPSNKNIILLYFMSPAYFNKNDTFSVSGTTCSLYVNGTSKPLGIPAGIFNENDLVSMLYNKINNRLDLLNPVSPFTDLSNVEQSDFYTQAMDANLAINPSMSLSYDSANNTYTLSPMAGYRDIFKDFRGRFYPFTTAFGAGYSITNTTIFKAPNKSGSLVNYTLYIGNTAASGYMSFSIVPGQLIAVLDVEASRIILSPDVFFTGDQYNKGIQLWTDLRLKANAANGSYLRFGDGDYCYLAELTDDQLTIHGRRLRLETNSGNTSDGIVLTTSSAANTNIQTYTSGTGKLLYNNTEVAKVDLSNTTSTQFETKLVNTSNFLNHRCTATKSGTVFALVVDPAVTLMTSQFAVSFVAPANFNAGDTFSLQFSTGTYSDFVPYLNGKIATKGFMLNDVVTLNVNTNSKKVFFRSSAGGLELPADYINGGIILPDKPEEIKKVTDISNGISRILRREFPYSLAKYFELPGERIIISKNYVNYDYLIMVSTSAKGIYLHKRYFSDFSEVTPKVIVSSVGYSNQSLEINSKYIFVSAGDQVNVYDHNLNYVNSLNIKSAPVFDICMHPVNDEACFILLQKDLYIWKDVKGWTNQNILSIGSAPPLYNRVELGIDYRMLAVMRNDYTMIYSYNIYSNNLSQLSESNYQIHKKIHNNITYEINEKEIILTYYDSNGIFHISQRINLNFYITTKIMAVDICFYGNLMFVIGNDREIVYLSKDERGSWYVNGKGQFMRTEFANSSNIWISHADRFGYILITNGYILSTLKYSDLSLMNRLAAF